MIRQILATAAVSIALATGPSMAQADSHIADIDAAIRAQSAMALESIAQDNRNALGVQARTQLNGAGFIDAAAGNEALTTAMHMQRSEALTAIRDQMASSLAHSVALQVEAPADAVASYSPSSSAPGAADVSSPVIETSPSVPAPSGKTRIGFRWQSLIPGVIK